MQSPLVPQMVKVKAFKRETSDLFTLTLDWQVVHEPGQFVQVGFPGIGESPISIASYSDEHIKLSIRQVGTVTNYLATRRKGDLVSVRGPYGRGYPMHYFKGDSLVFIGGGCGVAPLRGAIEFAEKHREWYNELHLFFGFRSPEDIIFKKALKVWEKEHNLNISVDKIPANTCYDGNVGFITELVRSAPLTNEKKVVMICGPPIMMEKVIDILKEKGFNDDQIFVSAERLMYCGIGKCGHCMIHDKYTCRDGPVFRWDEMRGKMNDS